MFKSFVENGKRTILYYHKTSGGAEYLTDKFIECPNGDKQGVFKGADLVIRIDGKELEIVKNNV